MGENTPSWIGVDLRPLDLYISQGISLAPRTLEIGFIDNVYGEDTLHHLADYPGRARIPATSKNQYILVLRLLLIGQSNFFRTTNRVTMALHKGKPSGINKPDNRGTGMPSDFRPAALETDNKLAGKYIKDNEELAENVRTKHPNRNTNKKNPTNAGGYKN